jgi:hypothetical protein
MDGLQFVSQPVLQKPTSSLCEGHHHLGTLQYRRTNYCEGVGSHFVAIRPLAPSGPPQCTHCHYRVLHQSLDQSEHGQSHEQGQRRRSASTSNPTRKPDCHPPSSSSERQASRQTGTVQPRILGHWIGACIGIPHPNQRSHFGELLARDHISIT